MITSLAGEAGATACWAEVDPDNSGTAGFDTLARWLLAITDQSVAVI